MICISIHAPLTGSDGCIPQEKAIGYYFNPRSPYGERPNPVRNIDLSMDFNPRSPYGERQIFLPPTNAERRFQSTLPLRGATRANVDPGQLRPISIHAPLTGSDVILPPFFPPFYISIHAPLTASDPVCSSIVRFKSDFNPRSPYGERPEKLLYSASWRNFNPRSPYGERLKLH